MLVGGLAAAVVSAVVPASVQFWTAYLETQRAERQLASTERERLLTLAERFATAGLEQDIEHRIRFAEYMEYSLPSSSSLTDSGNAPESESANRWTGYRERLERLRDSANEAMLDYETEIARLNAIDGRTPDQDVELAEFQRKIDQLLRRVGGSSHDRSLYQHLTRAIGPRVNEGDRDSSTRSTGTWRISTHQANEIILYSGRADDGITADVEVCNETSSRPHSNTWAWVISDGDPPIQLRPANTQYSGSYPSCTTVSSDQIVIVRRYETDASIFVPVFGTYEITEPRSEANGS